MRPTPAALGLLAAVMFVFPASVHAHAAEPPARAAAEAVPEGAMALPVSKARFWLGGFVESARIPDASLCDVLGPCPTWALEVQRGGERLRVAIDTPSREDGFRIEVLDPKGAMVGSADAFNQFDAEAFVTQPEAGTYRVRVIPTSATHAFFRLRAKLEAEPEARPAGDALLLPNLQAVPPYEFGFVAPANPLNGLYPPDTVNPPLSVAGAEPLSCAPDEAAPVELGGQGAKDCLRLTTGPINTGDGPFLKEFTFTEDVAGGEVHDATLRGPAVQRILRADGTSITRPAGTYSFHTTHSHFHDDGILTYELFRVDGEKIVPAGKGTKSGFCPADQLIGRWRSFAQDRAGTFGGGDTSAGNCASPTDGLLSLTRGWGDVYRWQRPGQFMEFAGNGDGYYVARTTVDLHDTTLETNEQDNAAYALIRVVGRRVELVERGQGLSHLDPAKEVFTGLGPASQDAYGGEPPSGPAATAAPVRDTRAPRVTGVRRVRGGRLRLALSERATVRLTFLRGGRRVAILSVRARRGVTVVRVPRRARRATEVALVARDVAGNYARVVRRRM